jgi:hypothetical protein
MADGHVMVAKNQQRQHQQTAWPLSTSRSAIRTYIHSKRSSTYCWTSFCVSLRRSILLTASPLAACVSPVSPTVRGHGKTCLNLSQSRRCCGVHCRRQRLLVVDNRRRRSESGSWSIDSRCLSMGLCRRFTNISRRHEVGDFNVCFDRPHAQQLADFVDGVRLPVTTIQQANHQLNGIPFMPLPPSPDVRPFTPILLTVVCSSSQSQLTVHRKPANVISNIAKC